MILFFLFHHLIFVRKADGAVTTTMQLNNERVESNVLCVVCQEEMNESERDCHKLPCGHTFHTTCIVKHLRFNNMCPLCRDRDGAPQQHLPDPENMRIEVGVPREAISLYQESHMPMPTLHIGPYRVDFEQMLEVMADEYSVIENRARMSVRRVEGRKNRLARTNPRVGALRGKMWERRKRTRDAEKALESFMRKKKNELAQELARCPEIRALKRNLAREKRNYTYSKRAFNSKCEELL
jgi:hypothetical protein